MNKPTGRVLKADNVKIQGSFHLDVGQTAQKPANTGIAVSAAAQSRILENNIDFAVIEITCACGVKTRVRCEYEYQKTNESTN